MGNASKKQAHRTEYLVFALPLASAGSLGAQHKTRIISILYRQLLELEMV